MSIAEYAEYALKACAVLVMVWSFFNFVVATSFTRLGLVLLFVGSSVAITGTSSGATLVAAEFLYPQTVDVGGLFALLWLSIVASLASVILFDLLIANLLQWTLTAIGVRLPAARVAEAGARSVFTALSLSVVASVSSGVDLSATAALAAGIAAAFVRYYLGLWIGDASFGEDGAVASPADPLDPDGPG